MHIVRIATFPSPDLKPTAYVGTSRLTLIAEKKDMKVYRTSYGFLASFGENRTAYIVKVGNRYEFTSFNNSVMSLHPFVRKTIRDHLFYIHN